MSLDPRSLVRGLLALALAFVARPAGAHDERFDLPGGLYVGGGVGVEYVNLPEVSAILGPDATSLGHTDDEFLTGSAHVLVGFVDREGLSLPDPVGRNARLELRGRFSRGHSDRTATGTPGGAISFLLVDDSTLADGLLVAGSPRARHETNLRSWEGDLLYRTDIEWVDGLVVSPLLGLTFTRLDLDNNFIIKDGPTNFDGTFNIDDRTNAYYGGLALGGELRARPTRFLEARAGARADLIAATADLEVQQNAFGAFVGQRREKSDHDTDFAARLTTSLGLSLNVGPVALALEGFARWLSYVPIARHPLFTGDRDSHIDGDDMWSAGGMARLSVSFH